jgi:hypothetical protein
LVSDPDTFHAVEIKSGETIASDFFANLDYWRAKLSGQTITPWLIHGGISHQQREKATVLPWNNLSPAHRLYQETMKGASPGNPPGKQTCVLKVRRIAACLRTLFEQVTGFVQADSEPLS